MPNFRFNRLCLGLAAASLLLAACGGGGGDGGTTPEPGATSQIPASASASGAGAFTFVNGVAATTDNGAEPLVVGDATLGTSDSDEPAAL